MNEAKSTNEAMGTAHQDNSWKWVALAVGALLLISITCLIGCLVGGIVGVSLFGLRSSRHMQYSPDWERVPPIPEAPEPWQAPIVPDPEDPTRPLTGRAWLGVTYTMVEAGAQIVEVTPGGPADQANLRVGDVIIAVEDKKVKTQMDLRDHILRHEPGDRVDLTLLRNGSKQSITVRLGTRPPDLMQPQQPFPLED